MSDKISVVINTYNASEHLREVLESVKNFDEIVICDMESTDETLSIAKEYNCKIVTFEKKGHTICEVARDFAIRSASHKWVLVIDADEIVTEDLRKYLYNKIADQDFESALAIGRINYVMGEYIDRSPDYQLRFFQKEKATWPPVIHSRPVINGPIAYAPNKDNLKLIHLNDPEFSTRITKLNNYSDYEVSKKIGRHFSVIKMLFRPVAFFFKSYMAGGAFRHGKRGVISAYLSAIYQMLMISKVVEKQIKTDESRHNNFEKMNNGSDD